MIKKNKLSKKHNVSELLNPKKTKKYHKLYYNFKKNIGIGKHKVNKANREFEDLRITKQLHNQHAGAAIATTTVQKAVNATNFGIETIGFADTTLAKRNVSHGVDSYNVSTKEQYATLKRTVYNTIRGSWRLKTFGDVTNVEHELLKRLLKSHLFFARIRLILKKLNLFAADLFIKNDSMIGNLQNEIREIFDLQLDIENANKNPNEFQTIKDKWVNIMNEGKYARFFKSKFLKIKTVGELVKAMIKFQDKLRMKLMKYTAFYNTADLGAKCNSLGRKLVFKSYDSRYRKSKTIICAIGKYRKYESKFNKFYYLFCEQFKKFIRAFPNCDGGIKELAIPEIDIDEQERISLSGRKKYEFEETKCFSAKQKQETLTLFTNMVGLLKSKQENNIANQKGQKIIETEKLINDSFAKKASDYRQLITTFTSVINVLIQIFAKGEVFGIRHHHGLPKKKTFVDSVKKTFGFGSSTQLIAKPKRLKLLSEDPTFIDEFRKMIKGFANDAKDMFEPEEDSQKLTTSLIPHIKLYESYSFNYNRDPETDEYGNILLYKADGTEFGDISNASYKYVLNSSNHIVSINITDKNKFKDDGKLKTYLISELSEIPYTIVKYNNKTERTPLTTLYESKFNNIDKTYYYKLYNSDETPYRYNANPNDIYILENKSNIYNNTLTQINLKPNVDINDIISNLKVKNTFTDQFIELRNTDLNEYFTKYVLLLDNFNIKQHFSMFSINLDKMENKDMVRENFIGQFNKNRLSTRPNNYYSIYELPVVVCVQSGFISMGSNVQGEYKDIMTKFTEDFLQNLYIPVSYSYAYPSNIQKYEKKFNIIYVRKHCIDETTEFNTKIADIKPVDQTNYFSLIDLPVGSGITLEKYGKSFCAANFSFDNPRGNTVDKIYPVFTPSTRYDKTDSDESRAEALARAPEGKKGDVQAEHDREIKEQKIAKFKADFDDLINRYIQNITDFESCDPVFDDAPPVSGGGGGGSGISNGISNGINDYDGSFNNIKGGAGVALGANDCGTKLPDFIKALNDFTAAADTMKSEPENDELIRNDKSLETDINDKINEVKKKFDIVLNDKLSAFIDGKVTAFDKLPTKTEPIFGVLIGIIDKYITYLNKTNFNNTNTELTTTKTELNNKYLPQFTGFIEQGYVDALQQKINDGEKIVNTITQLILKINSTEDILNALIDNNILTDKTNFDAIKKIFDDNKALLNKYNEDKNKLQPLQTELANFKAEVAKETQAVKDAEIIYNPLKAKLDKLNAELEDLKKKQVITAKALADATTAAAVAGGAVDIIITKADDEAKIKVTEKETEIADAEKPTHNANQTIVEAQGLLNVANNNFMEKQLEIATNSTALKEPKYSEINTNYELLNRNINAITVEFNNIKTKIVAEITNLQKKPVTDTTLKNTFDSLKSQADGVKSDLNNLKFNDITDALIVSITGEAPVLAAFAPVLPAIPVPVVTLAVTPGAPPAMTYKDFTKKLKGYDKFTTENKPVLDDRLTELYNYHINKLDNLITVINNDKLLENIKLKTYKIDDYKDLSGGGGTAPLNKPPINIITVVCTELVGSKAEDIQHIKEFNEFKSMTLRKVQIKKIFELVKSYNGTNSSIDFLCGDFGSELNIDANKINILKNKYGTEITNIYKDANIGEYIRKFFTLEPIDDLNNMYGHTVDDTIPNVYTNSSHNIVSNYIFYKNTAAPGQLTSTIPPFTDIAKYGNILPLTINIDITALLHDITENEQVTQTKGRKLKKIRLYTRDELSKIISILDRLMGHFTYGYKAYLKRDLGCFSFDNGDSSKIGSTPELSPYCIRDFPVLKTNEQGTFTDVEIVKKLKTFYSMNYPGFIDVFLYQLGANYNNPDTTKQIFYNENQISRMKANANASAITANLNFLNNSELKELSSNSRDTLIRMLLIPSQHLKAITTYVAPGAAGAGAATEDIDSIDMEKMNAKDYIKLLKKFNKNFYRETVIKKLEERMTKILEVTKPKDKRTDDDIKAEIQLKTHDETLNKGLLYEIIKITVTEREQKPKLANLNADLISKLFEFIFIMLKLKFINRQEEDIENITLITELDSVVADKYAQFSNKYMKYVDDLKIAYDKFKQTTDSTDFDRVLANIKENNEPRQFSIDIIDLKKNIEQPKAELSTLFDLKHMETYICFIIIIMLVYYFSDKTTIDSTTRVNIQKFIESNVSNILNHIKIPSIVDIERGELDKTVKLADSEDRKRIVTENEEKKNIEKYKQILKEIYEDLDAKIKSDGLTANPLTPLVNIAKIPPPIRAPIATLPTPIVAKPVPGVAGTKAGITGTIIGTKGTKGGITGTVGTLPITIGQNTPGYNKFKQELNDALTKADNTIPGEILNNTNLPEFLNDFIKEHQNNMTTWLKQKKGGHGNNLRSLIYIANMIECKAKPNSDTCTPITSYLIDTTKPSSLQPVRTPPERLKTGKFENPETYLFNGSTSQAIEYAYSKDRNCIPIVLNFANATNIGGGIYGGARAQEEELMRCCPQLYNSLVKEYGEGKGRYNQTKVRWGHTKWDDRLILTETVKFIRYDSYAKDNKKFVKFDNNQFKPVKENTPAMIITAAAPKMDTYVGVADYNIVGDNRTIVGPTGNLQDKLLRMIKWILSVTSEQNLYIDSIINTKTFTPDTNKNKYCLILGAWGCGAFAPETNTIAYKQLMAQSFLAMINTYDPGCNIIFAIPKDTNHNSDNYTIFKTAFAGTQFNEINGASITSGITNTVGDLSNQRRIMGGFFNINDSKGSKQLTPKLNKYNTNKHSRTNITEKGNSKKLSSKKSKNKKLTKRK